MRHVDSPCRTMAAMIGGGVPIVKGSITDNILAGHYKAYAHINGYIWTDISVTLEERIEETK